MQTDPTTFLSGPNATFIAELYARYLEDPQSVDASWRGFFAELADDAPNIAKDLEGASWAPRQNGVIVNGHDQAAAPARENGATKLAERVDDDQIRAAATDSIRALMMIRAYRVRGHLEANLDPLQLKPRPKHSEL